MAQKLTIGANTALGQKGITVTIKGATPQDIVDGVTRLGKLPTFSTNVGTIKTAVYKALGLSGWPTLKWNATGAILNGATIFGMAGNTLLGGGEAGREAVLPLDRNTGWMDTFADKVAQRVSGSDSGQPVNINVTVTLDGKVVGKSVVNYINGQARTTGQNPLSSYL